MILSLIAANDFKTIKHNADDIPGAERLTKIVSGLGGWGLILCVAAIVIAAIIWAFGAQSQNQAQATQGKKGVLVAVLCAAIIIAAPQLIQWGADFGTGFKAK
jgi:hypothetical protein